MNKPKIIPFSNEVEHETLYFFIMIFDILTGALGAGFIGFILAIVGLIVYCEPKDFHSGYFKCYSITRLVLVICFILLFIIFLIAYLFMDFSLVNADSRALLNNTPIMVTIFICAFLFLSWSLYLSINFVTSIYQYQESGFRQELTPDIEKGKNRGNKSEIDKAKK
jgi:hypothetical protein